MKKTRKTRATKTTRKFPLSHEEAVRFGRLGGNKLLIAEGRGEKITIKHRNGKTETINQDSRDGKQNRLQIHVSISNKTKRTGYEAVECQ